MRGATITKRSFWISYFYFNPHSPCGERHLGLQRFFLVALFQSTLPMRGATSRYSKVFSRCFISIHTPHAGSDTPFLLYMICYSPDFNPHSPCGERHHFPTVLLIELNFNPHSPCGERQYPRPEMAGHLGFQSTLPMRGATLMTLSSDEKF